MPWPGSSVFELKLEEVKADWAKVTGQIGQMVAATDSQAPQGFRLSTVTVAVAFTAKGKLAFIAEAGVQSTVTLTFTRPS